MVNFKGVTSDVVSRRRHRRRRRRRRRVPITALGELNERETRTK